MRTTISWKEEFAERALRLRRQCDVPLWRGMKEVRVASNQPVDHRLYVRHTAMLCSKVFNNMSRQAENMNLSPNRVSFEAE